LFLVFFDYFFRLLHSVVDKADLYVIFNIVSYCKVTEYSRSHPASLLWELTCNMGWHGVTCHLIEVTFPPLPCS